MSLRKEILDILGDERMTDAIIAKILERLPKEKELDVGSPLFHEQSKNIGWNSYHDTLKDLLTERIKP